MKGPLLLLSGVAGSVASPIEHVVLLMLENRAFDHLFGWAGDLLGVDGLSGSESNPLSTLSKHPTLVNVTKDAPYINDCDPCHAFPCTTSKIFGKKQVQEGQLINSSMSGFIEYESDHPSHCNVLDMFTPDKLPVTMALAQEFAIMDRFFCSVPGPTWPNRMFQISATSAGSTETGTWYRDEVGKLFPQKTIFDQVEEAGLTWRNYYNDTPWELFMEKIAFSHEEVRHLSEFYQDAAKGTLPSFSWINPSSGMDLATGLGSNDQHPDHDVRLGEWLMKDIYEAVRASPAWNKTLLVITYDEHGGFFDHVSPPGGVPPPADGESSYPEHFEFDRLGIRVPTILISPWIPKGTVISDPPEHAKPASNSEYDLTSILSSARRLLGMPNVSLTRRDAWAATFEHAITTTLREDAPLRLPDPPRPAQPEIQKEAEAPINDLQAHIIKTLQQLNGHEISPALSKQAELSPWIQSSWRSHHERVKRWSASPNFTLHVGPLAAADWVETGWDLTKSAASGTARITIATRTLRVSGDAFCLEATSLKAGAPVQVKPCFPTSNPDRNVRRTQIWSRPNDATLRAAGDNDLCLEAHLYGPGKPSTAVTLEKCNGDTSQHWAYHGSYPGEKADGQLEYGDALNCLGLSYAKTQVEISV